jgi:hypothetical protein
MYWSTYNVDELATEFARLLTKYGSVEIVTQEHSVSMFPMSPVQPTIRLEPPELVFLMNTRSCDRCSRNMAAHDWVEVNEDARGAPVVRCSNRDREEPASFIK